MSFDDFTIKVEDVGKCFEMYKQPQDRLKQFIFPQKQFYEPFWALQHISFEVKRGQSVGIIGQNGSGKSTLLQLITGILTPTYGKIDVKGKIGALIELGSGFNPEFTGRENVFLNGCLLGLSNEEVERKFDQIAAFADIGEHLERTVKTYSSGMMLRLAFAVQMAVEPEILIIDEALAVGDARFQLKCFRRLEELKANGTTILFVSHSIELVKSFCDQGLLLEAGKTSYWGDAQVAATKYYEILFPKDCNEVIAEKISSQLNDKSKMAAEHDLPLGSLKEVEQNCSEKNQIIMSFKRNDLKMSWGRGGIIFNRVNIKGLKHPNIMVRGSNIQAALQIQLNYEVINEIADKENCLQNLFVGIRCDSYRGISVFDIFHEVPANEIALMAKEKQYRLDLEFEIEVPELSQGNYFLSYGVAIGSLNQVIPLYSCDNVTMLTLESNNQILGQMRPKYTSKRML